MWLMVIALGIFLLVVGLIFLGFAFSGDEENKP
jgi:uncharacterized membrane protein HdeD (DUF308 family)